MNVGTPPEPGKSRLTIETYRVTPDGRRVGRTRRCTVKPGAFPEQLPDTLAWPACRCPRCRAGGR